MAFMPIKPGQPGYGDVLGNLLAPPQAPDLNAGFSQGASRKPGFMAPGSKAAMIAGIIGDTLASFSGGQPVFTMNMMAERRRQADAEAEDVQWSRRRQADNEDWQNREAWKLANPDPAPMVRDAMAWQNMTPEQRAAYEAMKKAQEGDPIVNTSLPNGQFYSGPRSGLAQALAGGQAAPAAPVGRLTPIVGGAGGNASGGFSY